MRLLDSFTSHSTTILVMEYFPSTVYEFIHDHSSAPRRFTDDRLLKLTDDTVRGLRHLHSKGIALCDIHPGNIFLIGVGRHKPLL